MSRILRRNRTVVAVAVLSALLTAGSMTIVLSDHAGAATTCPSGTSITLQNSPCAIQGAKDATVTLAGLTGFQPVASLPLPVGKYVVSASFEVEVSGNLDSVPQSIDCRLKVGTDSDLGTVSFNNTNTSTIVALSSAHPMTSPGQAAISCDTGGKNGFSVRRSRITAWRVGTLRQVTMV